MDINKFAKTFPGKLVIIDDGRGVAFVAAPLPRKWEMPPQLISLWVEAKEVLGELRGTARTLPDPALLLRPLGQREALRSSSLEGTYATPEELLAYELNPRDPMSTKDPANPWREVFNYQRALELGCVLADKGVPFSERMIRQIHNRLMIGVRGEDKNPGELRDTQVHVGAGRRFTPAPPEHLKALLAEFDRDTQHITNIDPLVRALMVHYQFEAIHPFRDGNGRVGRLLLALMIYKHCEFDKPWLYLSEFFDNHRDDYIDALFNVSANGDWARWIELGLLATIETSRNTVQRIRKLMELKDEYEERVREFGGRDRLMHIIPLLLSSPIIVFKDLMETLDVTYPTARGDMAALEKMKIVKDLGSHNRPRMFISEEIFNLAYSDD
ncbi:MAG: Fic family protein [Rhodospirillales bacterium]|nr:Fic family protein [Rhodospirillales bacterium]